MILSAVSLWKKYNTNTPLNVVESGAEEVDGKVFSSVHYSGHRVEDGVVRIYAQFCRPAGNGKRPAILLLPDAGQPIDRELISYFADKGYAVLMPDYSGKREGQETPYTVYPESISYGNYERAKGLNGITDGKTTADQITWFEWTYVALYSLKYLKEREDISQIGVVGIRKGGDIAWQTMLSPDVKCGVPINAVGWHSFMHVAKFGTNTAHDLSDEMHRYIAAVEAQSYAPSVCCPVLMLCSLRDKNFDCDRAYDTYSRIGCKDGNALVYSFKSGECIGPESLTDMDLFLEKNLKGREIYVPDTLNISIKESEKGLEMEVECDKEGILEEAGIFYAEADVKTRSAYRDWHCIYKTQGRTVKNGRFTFEKKPFEGATAVFAYAYAKYINGFYVMSKITSKRLSSTDANAVKSRMIFSGEELDIFTVANHEEYSIADVLLEREALPKKQKGYGDIEGAYSVGGIKTYKISSPKYLPEENAMLEFDVYSKESQRLAVSVHVADVDHEEEVYTCSFRISGGGKWKRVIFKAGELKAENGAPLKSFSQGSALSFECFEEEKEFSVTNVLWL